MQNVSTQIFKIHGFKYIDVGVNKYIYIYNMYIYIVFASLYALRFQ